MYAPHKVRTKFMNISSSFWTLELNLPKHVCAYFTFKI